MSGSFPVTTYVDPYEVDLTYSQPTDVSLAESSKRQARITAGHLWKMRLKYPAMTRAEFAPIYAFSISQRGELDNFTITLPQFDTPQGVATGTPLVDGAHSAGDSSIDIDGWTASTTGIIKAGDVLKFANHAKVYMVTADADSGSGAGLASVSIEPPLIDDLIDNEAVTVNNVPFTVAFDGSIRKFKTQAPQMQAYEINLIESL